MRRNKMRDMMSDLDSKTVGRVLCLLYRCIIGTLLCVHDPTWHLRSLAAACLGVNVAGLICASYWLLQDNVQIPETSGLQERGWSLVYHLAFSIECFSLIIALVYIGQVDALRVAGAMIFVNLARLALYTCQARSD